MLPLNLLLYKSGKHFSIVNANVWGPFFTFTTSGPKWFVSFIDDSTRVCWIYLMKHKSDVGSIIPRFYKLVCTWFNA